MTDPTRPGSRGPRPRPVLDRLRERTTVTASGCYLYTGATNAEGYGRTVIGSRADGSRRYVLTHRVAYEQAHGAVPDGLMLDHTCHSQAVERGECRGGRECPHRACWNPAHLEPVTCQANLARGMGKG